jgi:SSS family solute:Na+ symporter
MTPLLIILGYLSLLIMLGALSGRVLKGTAADYFLASRGIGSFFLLMSLFGTTMTAFALIGSTGESFKAGIGVYGKMASSSGIIHSACFFLVGIKLWALGKRFGYTTQIQFFRDRFESDKIGLVLFPILVGLIIPYLLIGVMGAGVTIEKVTAGALPEAWFPGSGSGPTAVKPGAVPFWLGSALISLVVLMYVFFGGVRGTTWANAFQTMVFLVLGMVTFGVIADKLGGLKNATAMVAERDPFMLRRSVRVDDNMSRYQAEVASYEKKLAAYEASPTDQQSEMSKPHHPERPRPMSKPAFLTYLFIPFSVGMFPHLFQHWLTARSAKSFRLAVVAHPLLIMLVWVPCVLIGVWACSAVGDNGKILLPPGINPNGVLGALVSNVTGDVLGGFLTAGVLAAIMSSLDSQFLCISSIFSNDIASHYIGHDKLTDAQKVLYGRIFVVMIVIVTYVLAQFRLGGVFQLAVWCFSGFAGLFPLVFASLYWRGVTKAGAYACVLTVAGLWWWLFSQSNYGAQREYLFLGMMPVATIFIASIIVLVLVSLMTRKPSEATITKFFGDARG